MLTRRCLCTFYTKLVKLSVEENDTITGFTVNIIIIYREMAYACRIAEDFCTKTVKLNTNKLAEIKNN